MSQNINYLMGALTSSVIEKMSGGKIKRLSPKAAAGLIGSWIVETGSKDLSKLDVVEKVAGAGRGLSQYTGARRTAYDLARAKALRTGANPNSVQWQLQYFVDEYTGKHDKAAGGKSLIGWTRSLENLPNFKSARDAAKHFTDNYFKPGVPHLDRRMQEADRVLGAKGDGGPLGDIQLNPNAKPQDLNIPQVQEFKAPTNKPLNPAQLIQESVKGLGIQI